MSHTIKSGDNNPHNLKVLLFLKKKLPYLGVFLKSVPKTFIFVQIRVFKPV